MPSTLPAFLFAVVLIWGSPGPAMLLVVRRAAVRGPRAAVATVLGLEVGLFLWAVLAAAGLAALVAASQVAYDVLRVTGAVVLIFLGGQALWRVWRERQASDTDTDQFAGAAALAGRRASAWVAFGEGAVVQLANPKIAVFMLAFYPQFLPASSPVLATPRCWRCCRWESRLVCTCCCWPAWAGPAAGCSSQRSAAGSRPSAAAS